MDRRTLLSILGGRQTHQQAETTATSARPPVNTGLAPYTGPFGFEQAAHLLRRTTFGPTQAEIKNTAAAGLDTTIAQLFAPQALPQPPLNFFYTDDPNVPVGSTWINSPYIQGEPLISQYRLQSLGAWTIGNLLQPGISLREKMTLFWHNHFVTSDIPDPKFTYKYITLLRENALGNFRELTKMITIDPAMLRYLNGRDNAATAPNENYARELLELFTIGKGPLAGPGDYTTYTEDDVIQMARVLTGWRDTGFFANNPAIPVGATFFPVRHDSGQKQLSHRFDNAVISNLGNQEYAHLIDVIFSREECARFLSRKLYRWFVYYAIDDTVEAQVIEPMAQLLIDNDYEVAPALEALLRSEHFFDMLQVGPMIKSPVDFVMSVLRTMEVEFPVNNLNQSYRLWNQFQRNILPAMQQTYYELPSVAGWKAYYQEPVFYRNWISSATLAIRMQFTSTMLTQGITQFGATARVDVLKLATVLDDPYDPNTLIEGFVKLLFPQPITQEQLSALKEILIPGLPDFEWTVEYTDYLANPNNANLAAAVESKLRNLLVAMTAMPEFYLS